MHFIERVSRKKIGGGEFGFDRRTAVQFVRAGCGGAGVKAGVFGGCFTQHLGLHFILRFVRDFIRDQAQSLGFAGNVSGGGRVGFGRRGRGYAQHFFVARDEVTVFVEVADDLLGGFAHGAAQA